MEKLYERIRKGNYYMKDRTSSKHVKLVSKMGLPRSSGQFLLNWFHITEDCDPHSSYV